MTAGPVAVLSDVHGNLTALEAVLADIDARGVTTIISLGDTVGKGPRGAACIALTRARCDLVVRGNWDEWLGGEPLGLPEGLPPANAAGVRWWWAGLGADDRAWLRGLPLAAALEVDGTPVRFVHASTAGVWTRVWPRHTAEEAADFFAPLAGVPDAPAVACYGDLHTPFQERTPDGLLVNVGSVGNPLDEVRAAYVLLEPERQGLAARTVRVGYDVEAELAAAAEAGMPQLAEWMAELREARYRGLPPRRQG